MKKIFILLFFIISISFPQVVPIESFDGIINTVNLHYSYNNQDWYTLDMNNNSGSIYDVVYTPDQEGIIIYYFISASDDEGQTSRYPQNDDENIMFVYGELEDIVNDSFEFENDNAVLGISYNDDIDLNIKKIINDKELRSTLVKNGTKHVLRYLSNPGNASKELARILSSF